MFPTPPPPAAHPIALLFRERLRTWLIEGAEREVRSNYQETSLLDAAWVQTRIECMRTFSQEEQITLIKSWVVGQLYRPWEPRHPEDAMDKDLWNEYLYRVKETEQFLRQHEMMTSPDRFLHDRYEPRPAQTKALIQELLAPVAGQSETIIRPTMAVPATDLHGWRIRTDIQCLKRGTPSALDHSYAIVTAPNADGIRAGLESSKISYPARLIGLAQGGWRRVSVQQAPERFALIRRWTETYLTAARDLLKDLDADQFRRESNSCTPPNS